ncbi:MAG TPA: efflux transporter outer membrane subunit [Steroidobacteraceae bacterium]|jgi:NodT family efflux transporter outer membrane factor (OMF) lipoprotein
MPRWSSPQRIWPAAVLTLIVSGCVAGPDFVAPAAPSATRYTTEPVDAGGAAEPDAWWLLLNSSQLDAVIREALAANRTLAAARSTLAEAQALSDAAEAGRYPHADLDAGIGRQKYGAAFLGPQHLPPFTYYSIGPAVSYTFDFAGGVHRTIEQQRALAEVQQHEVQAAALSLSGNVAMQALAAASAHAQIDNLQALLEDDRRDLKLVQDAFTDGAATRVDVVNAQSQLANDEALLPPLRRDLSSATNALAVLVGRTPDAAPATEFSLDEFHPPEHLPLTLPSELAHRRPDIQAAEARLHAATAAVGVASANLYPQISLTATASLQANQLRSLFEASSAAGGLAGSLTQPLFDHGALRARKQAAIDAMNSSQANYEQIVLSAFGQVADSLDALGHDQELLASEQAAVSVAAENLELTRESYSAGNSGVLQVLEAQRQNQQARVGLVRAESQRLQDTVQLLLSLGGRVPSAML